MVRIHTQAQIDEFARRLVAYAENEAEAEFVIPEDLTALSDDDLEALRAEATGHFDTLYGDGSGLSETDLETLASLTEGIETLNGEITRRAEEAAARAEAAEALAARVRTTLAADEADGDEAEGEEPAEEALAAAEEEPEAAEEPAGGAVTASSRGQRISLSGVRSRAARRTAPAQAPREGAKSMRDVVLAADVPGFSAGEGMDWNDVGRAVDRRLAGYNASQYAAAASKGRHMREQFSVAVLRKPFTEELTVRSNDPAHVDQVIRRAMDESRLPGGSLVASGGWCAPSETLYDLCELESRDGLLTIPEIGISRGGIQITQGPTFSDIYASTGFTYTEEEDAAGDYDGEGGGSKPCFKVECPEFQDIRLNLTGLCIQAGLLQSRGYPEVIARTTRGALVAHDHRMSANLIAGIENGSTAVTMPSLQVGATAPLLTAIELQVEHYRYTHRLARGVTLEAVFPFWVRGVVRSDLSRRLGVDLLSVPDARIDAWFRERGIAPQFVYNWQDLTGAPGSFTAWPTEVKFLLYSAGGWVKGGSDVITLDTIYDSTLLGTNDFTALFTEEGWLLAQTCHDSRVVSVNIEADGATHGGVLIEHDGTATPAE
jgi:hypothetical protein